jgi:hypothetical protein
MGAGRPSDYNPEIGAEICRRIAEGETIGDICKTEGMPSRVTVWNWTHIHPDFLSLYTRARWPEIDQIRV